jgi:hypothetical protein
VGDGENLEPPGQTLQQAPLDEQGRRAEEEDPQGQAAAGVLVPEPLHRLRPAGDLLDLVEDEDGAAVPLSRGQASEVPLGLEPRGVATDRIVGRRVVARPVERLEDLEGERRLPDLPGPGQDLEEPPPLAEPPEHEAERGSPISSRPSGPSRGMWSWSAGRISAGHVKVPRRGSGHRRRQPAADRR